MAGKNILKELELTESEVYFYRGQGGAPMYKDDEGSSGPATMNAPVGSTLSYREAKRYMQTNISRQTSGRGRKQSSHRYLLEPIYNGIEKWPSNDYLKSVKKQIEGGKDLSDKQITGLRNILKKLKISI